MNYWDIKEQVWMFNSNTKIACTNKCIENLYILEIWKVVWYPESIWTLGLDMTKSFSGGSLCNDDIHLKIQKHDFHRKWGYLTFNSNFQVQACECESKHAQKNVLKIMII